MGQEEVLGERRGGNLCRFSVNGGGGAQPKIGADWVLDGEGLGEDPGGGRGGSWKSPHHCAASCVDALDVVDVAVRCEGGAMQGGDWVIWCINAS
jgi:hypothetical protein